MGKFIEAAPAPMLRPNGQVPMATGSRGFVLHNDFGGASAIPQIDRSAFVQADQSGAAIGNAIAGIGDVGTRIGLVRAHAFNERKVLEADATMRLAHADIAKDLANEQDTSKWEEIAAKRSAELQKQLITKDLSPDAAEAISNRHLQWSANVVAGARESAAQREIQLLGQQHEANFITALNNNDFAGARASADAALKSGVMAANVHASKLAEVGNREKTTLLDDAKNKLTLAFQNGDESQISGIMSEARKIPGVQPSEFDLMEQTARINAKRNAETQKNKASADLYGSLVLQQAQGVVIVPAQIDALAKAGKLDPLAAARLREQAQSDTGAAPGDFNQFINSKVLAYNPDEDADFSKKQAIVQEAFSLGMRKDQAMRFNEALQAAEKRNATPRGRVETQLKKWGLEHIDEMHKNGDLIPWKSTAPAVDQKQLNDALQDEEKLKKLGFDFTPPGASATAASTIANLAKGGSMQQAEDEFVKLMGSRKIDAAQFNKLTPYEKDFFNKAFDSKGKVLKGIDPQKEMESGSKAAELQSQYEQAFDDFVSKNKRLPSADEARGMITTITKPFQDTAKWNVFKAPKTVSATPDKISIRGFEPADDLATKLPAPLAVHAQDFIDAAKANNLDPYALAAISLHETGGGRSSAFEHKNNAMGVSNDSGPIAFKSVRDSIMHQAKALASSPYYQGKDTLDQVGDTYAPTVGATNDPRNLNKYWKNGVSEYYNHLRQ